MGFRFSPRGASRIGVLACGFALSAPPVFADLSPQDVWDAWSKYFSDSGMEVTATLTQEGDSLRIADMTLPFTDEESEGSLVFDDIVFTALDADTVSITLGEKIIASGRDSEGKIGSGCLGICMHLACRGTLNLREVHRMLFKCFCESACSCEGSECGG